MNTVKNFKIVDYFNKTEKFTSITGKSQQKLLDFTILRDKEKTENKNRGKLD